MNLFDDIENEIKKDSESRVSRLSPKSSLIVKKEKIDDIVSVSQYLDSVNRNLKSQKARILGEVTGVKMYEGRSYLYYSVKDKIDQSTLNCFMWKRDYISSNIELVDGLEVIVTAYPSIYKPNGTISLQVEAVELVGEGALQIAYEKLKAKLSAEGLFDQNRKRTIPEYPHKIGVITSKSGAVINDFLSNVGKCGFEIVFVDSKVEGAEAIKDLLSAIKTLEKKDIDVLVMMRGGGSLESFQAFNNEVLVRAVAGFPVPVVTGIGHDKDAPLVSMVSDKNVSTPTAVANLISTGFREGLSRVRISEQSIFASFESIYKDKIFFLEQSERIMEKSFRIIFEKFEFYFNAMVRAKDKVWSQILRLKSDIENSSRNIGNLGFGLIKDTNNRLESIEKVLLARSPEQQLRLGWSISKTTSGRVIRSITDLKKGEEFQVSVSDGIIDAINK